MTTLKTTTQEIIAIVKPSEILVSASNYLQCIIDNRFCEFQKSYTENRWYQFKTTGKSNSPVETIIKWL